MLELRTYIHSIPDFPRPGILFRDLTPLLAAPRAMEQTVSELCRPFLEARVGWVAAVEARGFLFGAPAALALGAGFVPLRKPGKLPGKVLGVDYELEYGADRLELGAELLPAGGRVLLLDDLLATGGTAAAACALLEQAGAEVLGCAFVVELGDLGGRARLAGHRVHTLLRY